MSFVYKSDAKLSDVFEAKGKGVGFKGSDGSDLDDKIIKVIDAMNGDIYVHNDSGELDEMNEAYRYWFPARWPDLDAKGKIAEGDMTAELVEDFLGANFDELKKVAKDDVRAAKLAFLRLIAAINGLVHPKTDYKAHNVRYHEVGHCARSSSFGVEYKEYLENFAKVENPHLIRMEFSNTVCLVAIMFRARGHHYMDSMKARYVELWKKNKEIAHAVWKDDDWQYVATYGLHAILPDILDDFLVNQASVSKIANPYIKRSNCPAAGTAFWFALYDGIGNLRAVMGKRIDQYADQIQYVTDVVNRLSSRNERWTGSINRSFYGGAPLDAKVERVRELAAAVKGILDPEDVKSRLKESPALARVAEGAPIVNAIWCAISQALMDATRAPEIRRPLGVRALTVAGFSGEETVQESKIG